MSEDLIHLTFNRASDGSEMTVSVTRESIEHTPSGVLLSFHAYAGTTNEGKNLYLPYVLSSDNSSSKKRNFRALIDSFTLGGTTGIGYVKGANLSNAVRTGPNRMMISGIIGAGVGFTAGLLGIARSEITRHVGDLDKLNNRKHYYVTTDGPDLEGPIKLNV